MENSEVIDFGRMRVEKARPNVEFLYGDDINDLRVENYLLSADRAMQGSAISYITEGNLRLGEIDVFLHACLKAWHDGDFANLRACWPDYELFAARRDVAHQLFGAMTFNGLMANGMPAAWYEQAEAALNSDDDEKQIEVLLQAVQDVLPHYSADDRPIWLEDAIITLQIIQPELYLGDEEDRCMIITPSFK